MLRKLLWSAALTAAFASAAVAQTITFEADEDILVIRGRQVLTTAVFELIGPSDGEIRCIALDAEARPIASTLGYAEIGEVMFSDLDVGDVDRVVCRYL